MAPGGRWVWWAGIDSPPPPQAARTQGPPASTAEAATCDPPATLPDPAPPRVSRRHPVSPAMCPVSRVPPRVLCPHSPGCTSARGRPSTETPESGRPPEAEPPGHPGTASAARRPATPGHPANARGAVTHQSPQPLLRRKLRPAWRTSSSAASGATLPTVGTHCKNIWSCCIVRY